MGHMMKPTILVFAIAAACATSVASAGLLDRAKPAPNPNATQTWSAWGGQIGVRWNLDLMHNLGISLSAPTGKLAHEDLRRHEWFELREAGGLEFSVRNVTLQQFNGGSLQMRGGYELHLRDGSRIDLRDLSLRVNANNAKVLDVVSGDGKVWFQSDRLMFELADNNRTLAIRAADLRITPALAARIGVPESSGWELADLELSTEVNIQGSGAQPDRVCDPYPWPDVDVPGVPGAQYQADLFMSSFSTQTVGCQGCSGPTGNGIAAFAPSSTLRNNVNDGTPQATVGGDPLGTSSALYTANVAWYTKFSGNNPPYNNDQHPFLIWNLYRINADGSIEQIGRSGVKHAFLTINSNCSDSCNNSHSLGRGCGDTYGVGNNDSPGDMGPRSEIIPATGQWGRCGSIFDVNCDGSPNGSGNDSWTQRLKTPESLLAHTTGDGVSFLFESWYLAREDINIYNSMATESVNPQYSSSNWSLTSQTNYRLGGAIDRWVDPTAPPANAMNSELAAPEGHAKLAVKATDLGGGNWRYDYAVMNFDFARATTSGSEPNLRVLSNKGFDSFSVPLPAGATVSATAFRDGDVDSANDWSVFTSAGKVTWATRGRATSVDGPAKPSLDWGSMYSFSVTVNRAPASGQGSLHVAQTGAPAAYSVATLVPGS